MEESSGEMSLQMNLDHFGEVKKCNSTFKLCVISRTAVLPMTKAFFCQIVRYLRSVLCLCLLSLCVFPTLCFKLIQCNLASQPFNFIVILGNQNPSVFVLFTHAFLYHCNQRVNIDVVCCYSYLKTCYKIFGHLIFEYHKYISNYIEKVI